MKNPKRMLAAISLTLALGFASGVRGGEMPCSPPEPGETHSPPCSNMSVNLDDDSLANLQSQVVASDVILTQAAIGLLQSALQIF